MAYIDPRLRRKLDSPAPPNYVAGLGRGATGFTTRSDIGPATATPDAAPIPSQPPRGLTAIPPLPAQPPTAPAAAAAPAAPPPPPPPSSGDKDDDVEMGDYSDAKFDEWRGFDDDLFKGQQWDQDDDEADRVYNAVDSHIDARRKRRRDEQEKKRMEEYRKERPKLSTQFADLKKQLATISEEEWMQVPDIGDYSVKKRRQDIWTPVPDSLLLQGMDGGHSSSLDNRQMRYGGMDTPTGATPITPLPGGATPVTDLRALGEARGSVLQVKLKQISDSVTGQTVVDPKGYMTALSAQKVNTESEMGDLKRARTLLNCLIKTNPSHGPGWIALALVEQLSGKLALARTIIAEGCEKAPQNEEVWLEAVRLATPENAKVVIAKAVDKIPYSVRLWIEAANLETEVKRKKAVLRKALEMIPNSVRLWKEAIELEKPEDAKTLLSRAVECVNNIDLWLALARLETYDKAKKVLNTAREHNPTEPIIWITAAQLEEAAGNKTAMERIIKKAVQTLSPAHCSRETWIREAEKSESAGHTLTSQAIIFSAIDLDVEGDDKTKKHLWIDDAQKCIDNKCYKTARAIYAFALQQFPQKKGLWMKAADLEKAHGTYEELDALLKEAVKHCPHAEYLWLMAAKEKWMNGDVKSAQSILANAFSHNPYSENIWIAAVKLDAENGQLDRAAQILEKAREKSDTPRIWMKSAKLERQMGNRQKERKLLGEGLRKWPTCEKMWLMLLQWEQWKAAKEEKNISKPEQKIKRNEEVRALYVEALKHCLQSIPMWLEAVKIEEEVCKDVVKARALLEKARMKLPKNPELWVQSIRLEMRHNRASMAQQLVSKALQECPDSGRIWSEVIEMEQPACKRAKSVLALKKCEKDATVITSVAKIFWSERKLDTTRKWFNRAVALDKDNGDAWAFFYKFEVEHGTDEQKQAVIKRCVDAQPMHGERWVKVTKNLQNTTVGGCRLSTEEILKHVALEIQME